MGEKAARFDPLLDVKEGMKPGPATYEPSDDLNRSKIKSHMMGKTVRMPEDRYDTDAPGVGRYRM